MKKLIIATATALGLASAGGAASRRIRRKPPNCRMSSSPGVPSPYETYVTNLQTGYQLQALVGHTHRQYMQAQRAANESEFLRRQGLTLQPVVSVAIDNSSGPGIARQVQLIDAARETIAIVNVYCKRAAPSGGPRCRMGPQPTRAGKSGQRLASIQAADLRLAVADLRRK